MTLVDILAIVILTTLVLNIFLLFVMVFIERRKPQNIISWLFILTILPIVGFLFYTLFGAGLSVKTRRMLKKRKFYTYDCMKYIKNIDILKDANTKEVVNNKELIIFNASSGSVPCPYNSVEIFLDGKSKMDSLKKDLLGAKHSINIEYYIFDDDSTGKEIMDILCKKAKEGIKVKLIYDSVGSLKAPRRFFRRLKKAGGEVAEFFPPLFYIRLINFKMNYRNHRKVVVIDGKIGYTGGINLRDDHMGLKKKLAPWRDTHIRVEGSGVYALQNVFFNDWRYCKKDSTSPEEYVKLGYFPRAVKKGNVLMQVVTSGPDTPEQNIKDSYVKMITNAKKRVYIQSPYFIPDDVFMSAIKMAVKSGIDVRLMIPLKPDKRFVYLATLSFCKDIVESGVEVYLYDGFLHSKAIIVDDDKLSIGTCNTDNRSFGLNFEVNAFMFDEKLNNQYCEAFICDIASSVKVDEQYFKENHLITKMGQAVFRLLAPLL